MYAHILYLKQRLVGFIGNPATSTDV
jgi:hypothetical protein